MDHARPVRIAIAGAGFWAQFQAAAWRELPEIELIAICDPNLERARQLADQFQIGQAFSDPAEMLRSASPDLFDIIASVPAHAPLVELAAEHGVPVVCQKPMTDSYDACQRLVERCRSQNLFFAVHENWRWQRPLRTAQQLLRQGVVGQPFRARFDFFTAFDVFANQPALKTAERFLLADIGCHLFDAVRSMFGEVRSVDCQTLRVHPDVVGEQVATALLRMRAPMTVTLHLAYARAPMEDDPFPETMLLVEGDRGTLRATRGGQIRVTTSAGTTIHDGSPPHYTWVDPRYATVQASIVDCHADIVAALRGGRDAETSGADNLRTMQLVEAAYQSATTDCVVAIPEETNSNRGLHER